MSKKMDTTSEQALASTTLILTLNATDGQPEIISVVKEGGVYKVQTSKNGHVWVTQSILKNKRAALKEAIFWYN